MIKRLRKKFIVVTMCSVLAVLFLIVAVINIINYVNIVEDVDSVVAILEKGGGSFATDDFGGGFNGEIGGNPNEEMDGDIIGGVIEEDNGANNGVLPPPNNKNDFQHDHMSPETPFETRFFTVIMDSSGSVKTVNTNSIAAINQQQATEYASSLYNDGKTKGFYDNYRYSVISTVDGDIMYIFVDCNKELSNFRSFLFASIIVGFLALIAVFVLVFFLSGKITKPVAESYAKQKRFITDASHEIKTPLTVIGANVEILEMKGVENECLDEIKGQVKRLTSLTEKLVFLARMDEESQALTSTDFSLSDAVEESVKPFYAVAESKEMSLNCDIQRNVSYCGDEVMIRQLISLLLDNALKYSDDKGNIEVLLKTVGGKIQFIVSNPSKDLSGDLSVLFERFYRTDASRNSETGGHGIGLSIVNAIVTAHKGNITARAENGRAIFTVSL